MTTSIKTNNIGFSNKRKYNELKEYFGISFINRIDSIIELNNLSKDDIKKIISNNIKELKQKYEKRNITISISNKVKEDIIEISSYEETGARSIEKLIKKYIDSQIIDNILLNKTKINITNISAKTNV